MFILLSSEVVFLELKEVFFKYKSCVVSLYDVYSLGIVDVESTVVWSFKSSSVQFCIQVEFWENKFVW